MATTPTDAPRTPQDPPTFESVWAMFQETDRKLRKTEKLIDSIGKQVGGLHNSIGKIVELLMTPSLASKFRKLGYTFTKFSRNVSIEDKQILTGIDVFVENGEYALVVEVKSVPDEDDIKHHLKRMEILRQYADKHGDRRKSLGAIAAPGFSKPLRQEIISAGLFVIEAAEESVTVDVPEGFEPRKW
jgi:hypothetical protein